MQALINTGTGRTRRSVAWNPRHAAGAGKVPDDKKWAASFVRSTIQNKANAQRNPCHGLMQHSISCCEAPMGNELAPFSLIGLPCVDLVLRSYSERCRGSITCRCAEVKAWAQPAKA